MARLLRQLTPSKTRGSWMVVSLRPGANPTTPGEPGCEVWTFLGSQALENLRTKIYSLFLPRRGPGHAGTRPQEGQQQARQKLDTSLFSAHFSDNPMKRRSLPPLYQRELALREVKKPAQGQLAKTVSRGDQLNLCNLHK